MLDVSGATIETKINATRNKSVNRSAQNSPAKMDTFPFAPGYLKRYAADSKLMIDPNDFWSSNHYEHPPLTDGMIGIVETRLSIQLPHSYVSLLRIQNGGYTHGFAHPMTERTTWANDHVPLNDLAGIVTDPNHRTAQNLLDTEYMTNEWGLPERQALLSGDGHWWISLDYRNSATPSVIWLNVDQEQQIQIAPTFDDFLGGLVPASHFRHDDE